MEEKFNYEYFRSSQFYQELQADMDKLLEKAFNRGFKYACAKLDKTLKEMKEVQQILDKMEQ